MVRHLLDQPRTGMFHGRELPRLLTMLAMLGVLGMLIFRSSDPDSWAWLTSAADRAKPADNSKPLAATPPPVKPAGKSATAKSATAAGATGGATAASPAEASPLVATGPTDLDREAVDAMRKECQALTDGTLYIGEEEMFAYKRLIQWAHNQPLALMRQRARKDLIFDNFVSRPEKYRGQLVELDLNVRLVRKCDVKGPGGEQLSEVWGYTEESGNHLYAVTVIDLPKEMPVGTRVYETAKVVGYFLKVQGYEPGGAKPNARPLNAPLLIGRILWEPKVIPQVQSSDWTGAILGGVAVVLLASVLGYFMMGRNKQPLSSLPPIARNPDTPTLDEWLDRQDDAPEVILGNNFSGNGDSIKGRSNHHETGEQRPPLFPGDFDSTQN